MTDKKKLIRLIKALRKAQELAADITLGNGGECDSLIGSMCDDLTMQLQGDPQGLHRSAMSPRIG
jgi:hypothetical protein